MSEKTNAQHIEELYAGYTEDYNDSRFESDVIHDDYDLGDLPWSDEIYLLNNDLV